VIVTGEPGVGKTRLFEELFPQAVWMRCLEGLSKLPYHPILNFVRANLKDLDLGSYREDLARLIPEAAPNLVPAPLEPHMAKVRVTEALAEMCERFGEPVVIDDLQWADAATLEFLTYLATRGNTRCYAAYRRYEDGPELQAMREGLRSQGLLTEVVLAPLVEADVRLLLGQLIGVEQGPEIFSRWIFRRSGGNPLFTLETLKSLFENGTLKAYGGNWHSHLDEVTKDYSELDVPTKISELITRRVRNLPEATRRVIQAASVVGEGFTPKLLAKATGLSDIAVVDALDTAEANGLIKAERFAHDVLRQTLYASAPSGRRRYLHASVAESLEGLADPLVVAEHWLKAGNSDQAARCFEQAAETFLAQGLSQEALAVLERTRPLSLGEARRAALNYLMADGLVSLRRYEEASLLTEQLLGTQDPSLKAKTLILRTFIALRSGLLEDALIAAETARKLARRAAPDLYVGSLLAYANVCASSGHQESVLAQLEDVLRGDLTSLQPRLTIQLHSNLAWLYCGLQRFTEALPLYHRAIELAEESGDRYWWVWSVANCLYCCLELGQSGTALPLAETALPYAYFDAGEILKINLARAYLELRRNQDARVLLEELLVDCNDPSNRAVVLGYLADLYFQSGRREEGNLALRESLYSLEHTTIDRARARVAIATLKYGHALQRQQVLNFVPQLNPRSIPGYVWRELEGVLTAYRATTHVPGRLDKSDSGARPAPYLYIADDAAEPAACYANLRAKLQRMSSRSDAPAWVVGSVTEIQVALWLKAVTHEGVQRVQDVSDEMSRKGSFTCFIFFAQGSKPPLPQLQAGLVHSLLKHRHNLRHVIFAVEAQGLRGQSMQAIAKAMSDVVPDVPVTVCRDFAIGLQRLEGFHARQAEALERAFTELLSQAG